MPSLKLFLDDCVKLDLHFGNEMVSCFAICIRRLHPVPTKATEVIGRIIQGYIPYNQYNRNRHCSLCYSCVKSGTFKIDYLSKAVVQNL